MTGTLSIILSFASYAFVILAMFRLFRINYFNPIVKIFATYLEPISKSIFFFLNPLLAALALALLLQFVSSYFFYSSGYEIMTILFISVVDVINFCFRILYYCVIGSVILSWVAPENDHPLLQVVEEMSGAILQPIRKFFPPMGGLDFTPIIGFMLLNLINTFLIQIISSML
ncbi:YggT family protein [Gammaproteobacteria bacterium]|nr:YggT family protein [Gammaproteobacteria bacterium]